MAKFEDFEAAFARHPSLNASLEDFEVADTNTGPRLRAHAINSLHFTNPSCRSAAHSDEGSDPTEITNNGRYSPPAWHRDSHGNLSSGFWRRTPNLPECVQRPSIESDPDLNYTNLDENEILEVATRTRLPTGSLSPEKRRSPSPDVLLRNDCKFQKTFVELPKQSKGHENESNLSSGMNRDNYIRFSARAEVQHQWEPLMVGLSHIKAKFDSIMSSWISFLTSIIVTLITVVVLRTLFQPGAIPPVPDLVKVAGLARAFEPLIFYSENGIRQIGDLQATGIAVWDLGESVRITKMSSGPIIAKKLDELSESLKTLAVELTRFFANIDGDVDGILIVMDWARRELSQLHSTPSTSLATVYDNLNALLRRWGVLETSNGAPTQLGSIFISIFGPSTQQRTEATLQKTFQEFLSVLEDSINTELTHSLALFSLFSAIDYRFLNLARTVTREANVQENEQENLSSLWTKILGPNSSTLYKFEKNKQLLSNIRSMTIRNKSLLEDHNRKLLTLKANLENLRRKLVSPLLHGSASTIGLTEQIQGLEDVSAYLGGVRKRQRAKLMETIYGSGRNP